MFRRRRRRRMVVGGAVVVGTTEAMLKVSEADAMAIQQATGVPPEDMSHEELQAAMQQQNTQPQSVTQEDQQNRRWLRLKPQIRNRPPGVSLQ